MKRDRNAVRALLAQKADANASSADGSSALLWLVRVDDLEMARLLIQAGADATRPNRYGVTPLYLACSNGNAEMIQLLLDAGAGPERTRSDGRNAADDSGAHWRSRRRGRAPRLRGHRRRNGSGVPANGADDRGPRKSDASRSNARRRSARGRQRPDENRKDPAVGSSQFQSPGSGTGSGSFAVVFPSADRGISRRED